MAMNRLSISGKVATLSAAQLLLMIGTLVLLLWRIDGAKDVIEQQTDSLERVRTISQIESELADLFFHLVASAESRDLRFHEAVVSARSSLNRTLGNQDSMSVSDASLITVKIERLYEVYSDFRSKGVEADGEFFREIEPIRSMVFNELNSLRARYNARLNETDRSRILGSVSAQVDSVHSLAWWLMLLSMTVGAALAWWFQRSITAPISMVLSQLKGIGRDNVTVSKTLAESAQNVSAATSQQAAAIQESVAAATQMRDMVSRTGEYAGEAQGLAENVADEASRGRNALDAMVKHMEAMNVAIADIERSVGNMASGINDQLASVASIIGEISAKTNVINEIVLKTQLLSFNASIEAARAGQHGKGFAVVAQEVGSLARMSGKAARSIHQLIRDSHSRVGTIIETVQDQVRKSQDLVESGKHTSAQAHATGKNAHQVFDGIVGEIDAILVAVQSVAQACDEQNRGLDQIALSMDQMQGATENNNEVAYRNAQTASVLKKTAQSLARLGNHMEVVVRGRPATYPTFQELGEPVNASLHDQLADEKNNAVTPGIYDRIAKKLETFTASSGMQDPKKKDDDEDGNVTGSAA